MNHLYNLKLTLYYAKCIEGVKSHFEKDKRYIQLRKQNPHRKFYARKIKFYVRGNQRKGKINLKSFCFGENKQAL